MSETHAGADKSGRDARVAVVEDDVAMREDILVAALREAGFDAAGFACAADLYRAMVCETFDAILLDLGLPDEDGLSVAQHLRRSSTIGIVVLTGRIDLKERVQGLSELVDAWLLKPVDTNLVVATIASLLRRMQIPVTQDPAPIRHWQLAAGGWSLLSPSGVEIELGADERSLLAPLVAAAGSAVSRQTLITALAPGDPEFDPHRVETLVYRLRRKVAAATAEPLPLRAVRGKGYVLTLRDPHD